MTSIKCNPTIHRHQANLNPKTIQFSNYSKAQTTRLGHCSKETSSCVAKDKLFQVMEKGNKHGIPPSSFDNEAKGGIRTAETLLRLVPMALCVSALVIMLRDSQANEYGSISYSNLGAFRYLVHANGICAGYSLLSAVIVVVPGRPTMSRAWTLFFLDQVLTYAILAAGAASIEILFLAYHGDRAVTWGAACGSFGRFCHKATASVVITLLVVACYTILSLVSSYRLFSRFDAPVTCTTEGIQIPNLQG